METSSLTLSNLPEQVTLQSSGNPVETLSIVPAVATPPDPTSIPIEPPHGSPRPPTGQLMPDVTAVEDPNPQVQSPMKVNTPPPSTPSPVPATAPEQTESFTEADQHLPSNGVDHAYGQDLLPPSSELDLGFVHPDDSMFGDDTFKTEADGDAIMHGDHLDDVKHDALEAALVEDPNNMANDPNQLLYQSSPQNDFGTSSFNEPESLDGPPPAKRQKVDSPGFSGMAEDSPGAGLALESPVAPTAPWARPLTQPQSKFALSVIRSLKKMKDAVPFLLPVDPIALNIPQYSTIITSPMDLSTVEKKLGGGKIEAGQYPRYTNVEEFVADVKLIVQNCVTFNGSEHPVTHMVKRMEEAFDKQMKNMPTADDVKPPVMKPGVKKGAPVRRPSTAGSGFPRRDDSYVAARPKREVPPPRDQREYHEAPRRAPVKKRFPKRDDGTIEQLKFCTKLIQELYRPKYSSIASPFYDPVDYLKLDLPHYPKVIKKPMDMSTILHKLTIGEYVDARAFHADFKLMIKNCFTFNPAGTPVHQAGVALNEVFDERWGSLPPLYGETDDEGEDGEESDNDHSNAVMVMEAQIQSLHNALASLKKTKPKKEKIRKPAPAIPRPPKPSNGKVGGNSGLFKKKKKSGHDEEDNLTFEQKKQLSESIQTLDGSRLEKVLEIIDEVYPEIRETSEEIELDIDALPAHVLIRLYNFVIRPYKPRVGRPPNGSGSGKSMSNMVAGTKRKSMNEDEETAKIRQLEETLQRLKSGSATADDMEAARMQMNGASGGGDESGSESGSSDSSGSDSE